LANIVDVQQALYAVNKAETDMGGLYPGGRYYKAAASGDFNLFLAG
jgi:hypothetical protein